MANVLILGSGGREHAFAWKMAQSPTVEHVYVAPGNGGTAQEPKVSNIDIDPLDFPALTQFAKDNQISLTLVGPEAPLVAGIVDHFKAQGLRIFGPDQFAAQLEGSKAFSKQFMTQHHIPTARYQTFTEVTLAKEFVRELMTSEDARIVIKASGLAAGKGVIIAESLAQADNTIEMMLTEGHFGDAGQSIVIEEFLQGEEASFIVMVDGNHVVSLATSQDHKAIYDGDKGPNTGGMGAYSPAPIVTEELHQQVMKTVILPTIKAMKNLGHPYQGFLYAGLMIGTDNTINVLEFNCRCGDPETQPIIIRLQSDFYQLCQAAIDGALNNIKIAWDPRPALGVVMVAGGYPDQYRKGDRISGLNLSNPDNVKVFHAGTALLNNRLITNGGRVLCVTAIDDSIALAQQNAYAIVKQIHWPDCYYRSDIGYRAISA